MYLLLAPLLITADQMTKVWIKQRFTLGGEGLELGLGFSLTYVRNNGAAFGVLRDFSLPFGSGVLDGTQLLGFLSGLIATALLVYLVVRAPTLRPLQSVALTLIFSGAVGNMIDRLRLGYVVDFVHFQIGRFDFPVFNLADSCVVVGAVLLLLYELIPDQKKPDRRPPHPRNLKKTNFLQGLDSETPSNTR
jgi:signal peptidase II